MLKSFFIYPLDVFNLFPPFPRNNNVFVAISFDNKFDDRWKNVIVPAIKEVGLEPCRVDMKTISDSIITEIVTEINNCHLFFADVTTLAHCGDRAFRNENVLYEVVIAHSSRLPEEVILFRSDNDKLLFDLANIRINSYDPDGDPKKSKELVIGALNSALNEIILQKHNSVKYAVESLIKFTNKNTAHIKLLNYSFYYNFLKSAAEFLQHFLVGLSSHELHRTLFHICFIHPNYLLTLHNPQTLSSQHF